VLHITVAIRHIENAAPRTYPRIVIFNYTHISCQNVTLHLNARGRTVADMHITVLITHTHIPTYRHIPNSWVKTIKYIYICALVLRQTTHYF